MIAQHSGDIIDSATKRLEDSRRRKGLMATLNTKKAERRAGAHEAELDSLQLFFKQAARYPLLTAAEEVELAKRIERGDLAAKERMINCNLRLVVSIAKPYQTQGITIGHP